MGWFEEQVRSRQEQDDRMFQESFLDIAGTIMGKRLMAAFHDSRQQTEDAIGEILVYYHVKPRELPASLKDVDDILEYLLRPSGLMRRQVILDENWFRDAAGTMLGTKKSDGMPVALIPGKFGGYTWYDPASGKWEKVDKNNRDLFEREAVLFYRPLPAGKLSGKDLFIYMAGMVPGFDYALFALLTLAVVLVGLFTPSLTSWIFSYVTPSGSARALMACAVFFLSVTISKYLFGVCRTAMKNRIRTRMSASVEAAMMMRVLSLPASFFRKYSPGDLTNRMQYVPQVCETILDCVLTEGLGSLFSFIYIGQIVVYAPALALPSFLVLIATLGVSLVYVRFLLSVMGPTMEDRSKVSGMEYSLFTGIQKIRLAGAEKRAFARWGRLYARTMAYYCTSNFTNTVKLLIFGVPAFGMVILYALAVQSGVSPENFYAYSTAFGLVSGALLTLAANAQEIALILPGVHMVEPILQEVPEVAEEKQVVTRLSGGIELNNISFRYRDSSAPVLDNLSLKIRPGQYVAITGKTGCGKSTLMRIMLGMEKPERGAVYYDGRDLNTLDLKSLRRRIGVVMQNSRLFAGSILSNLSISAPGLSMEEAWKAAEMAGMKDDIERMPMKMFTMITEGSGGISGGQKQRLIIARAIAPKPRILMFDEATSALDNITQRTVSESLAKMKCTRIVIAHRLSTIQECDRIIVLDEGRIAEDGTYEELLAAGGLFTELVKRQQVSFGSM